MLHKLSIYSLFSILVIAIFANIPANANQATASKQNATSAKYIQVAKNTSRKKKKVIRKSARKGLRYYIEFRARPNGVADHSYIAYGRLTRRGKPYKTKYVGLHPKGGSVGMLVGVVAMEAQLEPMPEDKTATLTTSYRVPLTRKEYRKLVATISAAKKDKDSWGVWNPILNNCNSFVGFIARSIGLQAPTSSVVGPTTYVNSLRDINEGGSKSETGTL